MKTFRDHLKTKLIDKEFRDLYDEERQLLEISLKILNVRKELGLSQKDLAYKAHVTQQQISKIESGLNCNITTFLKVCNALGVKMDMAM